MLFVGLTLFVYTGVSRASSPPPPAKADLVIPLLRLYNPKDDSEKAVTAEMVQVLGSDFSSMSRGPGGVVCEQFYLLNDHTCIRILFVSGRLKSITRQSQSARDLETLYPSRAH